MNLKVSNNKININNTTFQGKVAAPIVVKKQDEDTFELSNDKKIDKNGKFKTFLKTMEVIGAITASAFLAKGALLYKQFKFPQKFAEHIDFKPAKTMEEAKKFALENFRIKEFNVDNSLNVANYINEGLAEISNKYKGNIKLPDKISYSDEGFFGYLNFFTDSKKISLKDLFKFKNTKNQNVLYIRESDHFSIKPDALKNDLLENIKKYCKNDSFSDFEIPYLEKNKDFDLFRKEFIKHYDYNTLENYIDTLSYKEMYKYNENLEKLQIICPNIDYLNEFALKKYYENNKFTSIAQKVLKDDYLPLDKLKELDAKSRYDYMSKIWDNLNKPEFKKELNEFPKHFVAQIDNSSFVDLYKVIGDLNNKTCNFKMIKELENNKDGLQAKNLKKLINEFEEEQTTKDIASRVSDTAHWNPAFFISETYAKILDGRKFDDEVMELYKRCGGPKLPD